MICKCESSAVEQQLLLLESKCGEHGVYATLLSAPCNGSCCPKSPPPSLPIAIAIA